MTRKNRIATTVVLAAGAVASTTQGDVTQMTLEIRVNRIDMAVVGPDNPIVAALEASDRVRLTLASGDGLWSDDVSYNPLATGGVTDVSSLFGDPDFLFGDSLRVGESDGLRVEALWNDKDDDCDSSSDGYCGASVRLTVSGDLQMQGQLFGLSMVTEFQDMSMTKYIDASTPKLAGALVSYSFTLTDYATGAVASVTGSPESVTVTPTPGAMAMLGLGGAMCARRRRSA